MVELYCPKEVLENGITLIDSPGLNENERLDKMVLKYLPKTTGVICIVSASQGVTMSLKKFLSHVAKLPNYSPRQMFIVVTHWDLIKSENEQIEFTKKMELEIRKILPTFDDKNVVKINLKSAFVAAKTKTQNTEYNRLMDNLVPFFKKAFKLKLQKQWVALKEVLRYSNSLIKVIYNKTQDIMEGNALQLVVLLKEIENFEKNGEILFKEFGEFVKQRSNIMEKKLVEIVNSQEFVNQIVLDIMKESLPKEENAVLMEAWLHRVITEKFIKMIATREDIKLIFKQTQDDVVKGANIVFGKVLFDLESFEKQMTGGETNEENKTQREPKTYNEYNNLNKEDLNSFSGFTEGEKVCFFKLSFYL